MSTDPLAQGSSMNLRKTFTSAIAAAALLSTVAPLTATAADPSWMTVDAAKKAVHFEIKMGTSGEASGLNFNGYSSGHLTITVPLGWNVSMNAVNDDSLPHSVEVVDAQKQAPMDALPPAFPQAETVRLKEGLAPNKSDSLSFTADKEGRFWLMCGVAGHAQGGMWDWFVVSKAATIPTVTITH